jgi:hypothetical protein
MSFDEPTQQIRRPDPPLPMPGPLDQTRPRPQVSPPAPEETGVLPLDELLGPPEAAEATVAPAGESVVGPARMPPSSSPVRAPMTVVPVRSDAVPSERPGPGTLDRIRADASTVLRAGSTRSGEWLRRGDNAVIVLTVLVAALLLSVVATVG